MPFRFLAADKISDPESAERVLARYMQKETQLVLEGQSINANLLDANAAEGLLQIKFTWAQDSEQDVGDVEHFQRFAASKVGNIVRFKVGADEFIGLLSGITDLPAGATVERYINTPFAMTFAFSAQDQIVTSEFKEGESAIIGVPVPANVCDMLPLSSDLPYEPHITVAYFPSLSAEDRGIVLEAAREVGKAVGVIDVKVKGTTVFPTQQEDGTYPLVALIDSPALHSYHELVVEKLESLKPGLVSLTFAGKNYTPHVTLDYVKDRTRKVRAQPLVWTVSYLTLNVGDEPEKIQLGKWLKTAASLSPPYIQRGDVRFPLHLVAEGTNTLRVRLKDPGQENAFKSLEGHQVKLVTSDFEQELEVLSLQESATGFIITYRSLVLYVPKEAARQLEYVAAVAKDRGVPHLSARLLQFEDEAEDEDRNAVGPGFEGTDEHIVTYVKAPQTQVIVKEPKFPRSLPLGERLS